MLFSWPNPKFPWLIYKEIVLQLEGRVDNQIFGVKGLIMTESFITTWKGIFTKPPQMTTLNK